MLIVMLRMEVNGDSVWLKSTARSHAKDGDEHWRHCLAEERC